MAEPPELREVLAIVNAVKQSAAVSRDKAAEAGRANVASHRQSDVETCERIERRLREQLADIPSALYRIRFTIQKCGRDEAHEWLALGEDGGKCPICGDAGACDYRGPFVAYADLDALKSQRVVEEAARELSRGAAPSADVRTPRPRVVCLCGSTRFAAKFNEEAARLTLAGEIVVRPEVVTYSLPDDPQHFATKEIKRALDELHLRKIDLADYVRVLNVGGYVGESTREEIEYARRTGKPVEYIEGGDAPCVH